MRRSSYIIALSGALLLAFLPALALQGVSDAQKRQFIELLKTLPHKGEFYTDEAVRRAGPYLPALFSLTEKDIGGYDLYPFAAISRGLADDKQHRAYAVAHFAEIRHPELKLFWAAMLFDAGDASREIVRYLNDALDNRKQAELLAGMVGPDFKFFKRKVRTHPYATEDGKSARQPEEDEGHADWVVSVAFSPDGRNLIADGGPVQVWDLSTGREVGRLEMDGSGFGMALSPDGKSLLLGVQFEAELGRLELWDVGGRRLIRRLPRQPHPVEAVAFAPDGKTAASESHGEPDIDSEGIIKLWDVNTGAELHRLVGHKRRVAALAFAPDGKTLASGSWDHTVRLWDVATGREIRDFPAVR